MIWQFTFELFINVDETEVHGTVKQKNDYHSKLGMNKKIMVQEGVR